MRPIFTTGTLAAYVSTTAICSRVSSLSRTASAVDPAKVSAQSPPWRTNTSPRATAASRSLSWSHSPAKTSGGCPASSAVTARTRAGSGQSGCWAAGSARQVSRSPGVIELALTGPRLGHAATRAVGTVPNLIDGSGNGAGLCS